MTSVAAKTRLMNNALEATAAMRRRGWVPRIRGQTGGIARRRAPGLPRVLCHWDVIPPARRGINAPEALDEWIRRPFVVTP